MSSVAEREPRDGVRASQDGSYPNQNGEPRVRVGFFRMVHRLQHQVSERDTTHNVCAAQRSIRPPCSWRICGHARLQPTRTQHISMITRLAQGRRYTGVRSARGTLISSTTSLMPIVRGAVAEIRATRDYRSTAVCLAHDSLSTRSGLTHSP